MDFFICLLSTVYPPKDGFAFGELSTANLFSFPSRPMPDKNHVIIVAGGSGLRMKTEVPKQFLLIAGKPVLMHTIERFHAFDPALKIIVVLPAKEISAWQSLCEKHAFTLKHVVVKGGNTRFHSVQNGLDEVHARGIVAIHDGVRPLVSNALLKRCFSGAKKNGNAVPCIHMRESVRKIRGRKNEAVDRDSIVSIQTPQCFTFDQIKKAYLEDYKSSFTDDASVVELSGNSIHLVEGDPDNIKITYSVDLSIAEVLFKKVK